MLKLTPPTRLALAALVAITALAGPAYAGDQTRAEAAIAAAKGKIDAGDKVNVANQAPELQAQARAELVQAQDLLGNHHKKEAIAAAQHAGELADQAIVAAHSRQLETERMRRADIRDTANAAQASANQTANMANNRADNAQNATNMANMRADSAERSAAAANAEAQTLRNTPPAPTTTTMSVSEHQTTSAAPVVHHKAKRRVVHHKVVRANGKTTTTTVTTSH